MRRHIYCLFLISLFLIAGASAQSKIEKRYDDLAATVLKDLQACWPVHATEMGVHDYDGRFPDYAPDAVRKNFERFKNYLPKLHQFKPGDLPLDKEIDLQLLKSNCEIAILTLSRLQYFKINPNLYLGDAADGIQFILAGAYSSPKEKARAFIDRLEALPDYLWQGEENLQNPPPIWLNFAKSNLPKVITFYQSAAGEMVKDVPDKSSEIKEAAQKAVTALEAFGRFLETLTPGADKSFAIGKEYYDYILSHEHLFGFDSDSLLKIGERLLAEAGAARDSLQKTLTPADDSKSKPLYVPPSIDKNDVLQYYSWEVDHVRQFLIDHDIVTVPKDISPCTVVETPDYMRGTLGGIAYQPAGAFTPKATCTFYVRPVPDTLNADQKAGYFKTMVNRGFRGSVVHEVYPGHHLQLQLAARVGSDVRRWQFNNCLIEGWALYCEEMAGEVGILGDDPARKIGILGGVMFRAARIIVDVKLQTGQFDYDQAVKWMTETLKSDSTYIKSEVLRYTMTPGQPMTYLMGKRAIVALRDRLRQKEGSAFSLKRFHDRLLAEGSIPISLIEKKLLP